MLLNVFQQKKAAATAAIFYFSAVAYSGEMLSSIYINPSE